MPYSNTSRDIFVPWLALAATVHVAAAVWLRLDASQPAVQQQPTLEVSLLAAVTPAPSASVSPTADKLGEGSAVVMSDVSAQASAGGYASAPVAMHDSVSDASRSKPIAFHERSETVSNRDLPAAVDAPRSQGVSPDGLPERQAAGVTNRQDGPPSGEHVARDDSEPTDVPAPNHPEPARLDVADLGRQISEWSNEYTQRTPAEPVASRRTAYVDKVTASHRVTAAAYEGSWQDKVERVGNMNYPEEARKRNLTGGLVLAVGVNADGTIAGIQVRRSSGYEELDQAAARIVNLAAPFGVFPAELKKDYDILWITRTWRFFVDNHLSTSP